MCAAHYTRWRSENIPGDKDKRRGRGRDWYRRNKERIAAKRAARDEKEIAEDLEYGRRKHYKNRLKLMKIVGQHNCARCGCADITILQFDHIHNGGSEEKRKLGGPEAVIMYYLHHPEEAKKELQLLCPNCNTLKYRSENPTEVCSVAGCGYSAEAKGLCGAHYMRWHLLTDPEFRRRFLLRHKMKKIGWTKDNWQVLSRKRRALSRLNRYEKLRRRLFTVIGQSVCVKCGFATQEALHFDHKHNDGAEDRRKFGRNLPKFYRYYIEHPAEAREKLQVLCANCNTKKHRELMGVDAAKYAVKLTEGRAPRRVNTETVTKSEYLILSSFRNVGQLTIGDATRITGRKRKLVAESLRVMHRRRLLSYAHVNKRRAYTITVRGDAFFKAVIKEAKERGGYPWTEFGRRNMQVVIDKISTHSG